MVVIFRIMYFRSRVNRLGYNNLLKGLEGNNQTRKPDEAFTSRYNKYYKAASFFLTRLFRDPNPCMIRSLILYGLCADNSIKAVLKTGVQKGMGSLEGHSWVEVDGDPLNENIDFLKGFTVVHET